MLTNRSDSISLHVKSVYMLTKKSNIMHFLYYQFDRVCKLFCEDPATSQSDEFFGVFDVYITSLSEARSENDNIRRKREEEEKIAKQHQEVIEHFTASLISFV